jgi:hypothetical protein
MDRQTLRAMMDKSHALGRHPRSTDHRLEEAIAYTNYDKEACDMANSMMVTRLTMGTKLKVEEYPAGVGSAGGKNGVRRYEGHAADAPTHSAGKQFAIQQG